MASQFHLLTQRRFAPFFCTQALGAFNDNVYKNLLLLMVAFAAPASLQVSSDLIINLAAGLFILPFFLFSAHAGLLADKLDKDVIIRRVKLLEIIIMSTAAVAILSESYLVMLVLLFLMGTQSAYFGPVKYSILPQHLNANELMSGNALVEMGTFLAILMGTLVAGVIVGNDLGWFSQIEDYQAIGAIAVVSFSLLGYLAARLIPSAKSANPELSVAFSPFSQTVNTVKLAKQNKTVFIAIIGISWFWFYGASYLTQFPNFTALHLQGSPEVVSVLLAVFSVGVGAGSLLCATLSKGKVNPKLVLIGCCGLTVFGGDLFLATPANLQSAQALGNLQPVQALSIAEFFSELANYRVMFDLVMVGLFGGLYIVPLYTLLQTQSSDALRAQMIAANNIMNALLMVSSAVLAIVLLAVISISIPEFFLVLALLNILVFVVLSRKLPSSVE